LFYPQLLIIVKFFAKNLLFLRKRKGFTQAQIADSLGVKQSTYANYESGFSKPALEDFIKLSRFFDTDEHSILHEDLSKGGKLISKTGDVENTQKGKLIGKPSGKLIGKLYHSLGQEEELPMVQESQFEKEIAGRLPLMITVDSQGEENVLFVPVKARAGYLTGYSDPEYIQSLPTYRLPGLNNGTFRMFEVGGNSMYNTLHDHDIVIGSYIEQWRDVRDDRVHVVVTKNEGIVVKRVLNRFEKEGKFILKSDNYKDRDLYPPIVVDPSDILEFWYGIAFMSRQMRPPTETYKRVVDLEGRLTLLEDSIRKGR
jgi:transcriptional regulator with XRE-family HTH domain